MLDAADDLPEEKEAPAGEDPLLKVNHPDHYGGDVIYEAWKVIEVWDAGFFDGNALKYICRWRAKGGVRDLKAAVCYLQKLIEIEEKKE